MRKLGMQNPVYMRNNAEKLISYIDGLFGDGNMPQCKNVITRIQLSA